MRTLIREEGRMTSSREWMKDAACRDYDPGLFYPERDDEKHEAIRICRDCPVRRECLIYAFAIDDRFGVLGGLSKNQRSTIRNRMRRNGRK